MRHWPKSSARLWMFALAALLLLPACYRSEAERLKKELATAQEENETLRKKIDLLTRSVQNLSELNALNVVEEHKGESVEKAKIEAK